MLEDNLKLKDNEKVLFIARLGFRYYKFRIAVFLLLILIPAFFYFFLLTRGIYGILILITIPFAAILYGIRVLVIYYFNVYIFTDERIIGIEQKGFFERVIMEIRISLIKRVSFFKKNSLYLELLDGKNLILEKLDDREYIYEILREQIGKRGGGSGEVEFRKREI